MAKISIQEAFNRLTGKARLNTTAINNRAIKDLSNVENGVTNVGKFLSVPAGGVGVEYKDGTSSPWTESNYTINDSTTAGNAFRAGQINYLKGGLSIFYDSNGDPFTVLSYYEQPTGEITVLASTANYKYQSGDPRTGTDFLRMISAYDPIVRSRLQLFIPGGSGGSGGSATVQDTTMDDKEIKDMEAKVVE